MIGMSHGLLTKSQRSTCGQSSNIEVSFEANREDHCRRTLPSSSSQHPESSTSTRRHFPFGPFAHATSPVLNACSFSSSTRARVNANGALALSVDIHDRIVSDRPTLTLVCVIRIATFASVGITIERLLLELDSTLEIEGIRGIPLSSPSECSLRRAGAKVSATGDRYSSDLLKKADILRLGDMLVEWRRG